MVPFHQQLVERARPAWDAMLDHPFLAAVADGSMPDDRFAVWLRQDYLFVQEAVPFLALLLAKAPPPHRRPLAGAIAAFQEELALFERMAQAQEVQLAGVEPSPTCHAYLQFLHATGYGRSYREAFTVLYGTERTYLESWSRVKESQRGPSRWQPFVENWTSDAFRSFVDWLGAETDRLAADASPADRDEMAALFVTTVRYEVRFWDMAFGDEHWPG